MTSLLVDTSVLIKWFHSDGESEDDVGQQEEAAAAHAAPLRVSLRSGQVSPMSRTRWRQAA